MMNTLKILFEYILSDYQRNCGKILKNMGGGYIYLVISVLTASNASFTYLFWWRLTTKKNVFFPLAALMCRRLSRLYGIQIGRNAKIGYGFYIGHGHGVIINGTAIIGNNCNISQFTTIGSNHGKAATIGDNVYIGPGVCIVEDVLIGNNVTIGAGAVVVKDIPDNATVAGVPAKIISFRDPARYVNNRYNPIK